MSESYKFLEKKLKELFSKFPKSNIRYEFVSNRDIHLIEVTPLDFYNNEKYKKAETIIEDEFELLFPKENILFISDESLNKITKVNLELLSEVHGRVCLLSFLNRNTEYYFENSTPEYIQEFNYAIAA